MNIGEVSKATGLPVKTIRYYEDIELVRPQRSENGYRAFLDNDVHKLQFLARSRSLGFSIDECRKLLSLYEERDRASADVKRLAEEHVRGIDRKISELQQMRNTLSELIKRCHGDERPDCPILSDLAREA